MTLAEMAAQYEFAADRITEQIKRWKKDPEKKVHMWRLYGVRDDLRKTAEYLRRYYCEKYVHIAGEIEITDGPDIGGHSRQSERGNMDRFTQDTGRTVEKDLLCIADGINADTAGDNSGSGKRENTETDSGGAGRVLLYYLQDLSQSD